jgi:hypothetical protein
MNHSIDLHGKTDRELQALQTRLACDFFADISEQERDAINTQCDVIKNCLPHSFVLASLFDVEAMSNDIPDHVYEADPSLEWVTCPCCDGEKWLEVEGNVWTKALFSDPRRAYAHRHLNHSYKVCGRCNGVGEVLDDLTFDEQTAFNEVVSSSNIIQTEYKKTDLTNTAVAYKDTPTIWRLAA